MRDLVTSQSKDQPSDTGRRRPSIRVGLAGRLIVLIAAFVMLAEIMIYVPAIANMRATWMRNHTVAAATAALVMDAAPDKLLSDDFTQRLLKNAGARVIVLDKGGTRRILAAGSIPATVDETDDLRESDWGGLIAAAYRTLTAPDGRVLTILGPGPLPDSGIEVTMDEAPLKKAMHEYSRRLLVYSLIVSVIVATLAALSLHRMILRPVRRLTSSIVEFGADPIDRSRIIAPSMRSHEIGQAERALAVMQEALALELSQKKNLANLGLAVAKINHDMRNMLASAQLLSDRLANLTDPLAQRLAPKLVATLDRAIRFCQATLTYGRAADEPPRPRPLMLRAVAAEAAEAVAPLAHGTVRIENEVPADLEVTADAEQMFRILMNLMRNGVEALERAGASPGRLPVVTVRAWKESATTILEIADTGPGIPAALRPKIFSAFQNSTRPGGTGLGLAIVADLIRAHGGTIELRPGGASTHPSGHPAAHPAAYAADDEETGACFRIALPWLPAARATVSRAA